MNKREINIRKLLQALILAFFTQVFYIIRRYFYFNWTNKITNFFMFGFAVFVIPVILIAINNLVFPNYKEWFKYSPIYLILCFASSFPGSPLQTILGYLVSIVSKAPVAVEYLMISVLRYLLWCGAVYVIGVPIKDLKNFIKEKLYVRENRAIPSEKTTRPFIFKQIIFPLIAVVLFALPMPGIILWVIYRMEMILNSSIVNTDALMLIHGYLFYVVLSYFIYPLIIIYATLKVHKNYKHWLIYLPLFVAACSVFMFVSNPIMHPTPVFFELPVHLFSEEVRAVIENNSALMYAIAYFIQWFVILSAAFGIRAILRNRRKGSNADSPGRLSDDVNNNIGSPLAVPIAGNNEISG